MFPASLHLRQKTQVLQQNVKIYSLVFSILACDWQLQKKSYGRLSGNNRPITDYLKNGRLIGFADYLPINRLIPISLTLHVYSFYSLLPIICKPQYCWICQVVYCIILPHWSIYKAASRMGYSA
jgi:hypothetical protein